MKTLEMTKVVKIVTDTIIRKYVESDEIDLFDCYFRVRTIATNGRLLNFAKVGTYWRDERHEKNFNIINVGLDYKLVQDLRNLIALLLTENEIQMGDWVLNHAIEYKAAYGSNINNACTFIYNKSPLSIIKYYEQLSKPLS